MSPSKLMIGRLSSFWNGPFFRGTFLHFQGSHPQETWETTLDAPLVEVPDEVCPSQEAAKCECDTCIYSTVHSPSTHVETPTVGTRGPCFIIFLHFFCWAQNPPAPKTGCLWVWGVFTISFLEPPLNSRLGDSDPDPRTHEFETSPHLRGWYLDSVDGWTWRKNIWDLNTRSNDEAPHGNNILSIKKSN